MAENIKVCPSILSADFAHLGNDVEKMRQAGADMLHIDVMDGHFVPNLSIGVPVLKSLRQVSDMFMDVHLMITHPMKYVEAFADAGADSITFHVEAHDDAGECIEKIHSLGKKAAISLKPATPAAAVEPYLGLVDMVLVMTVEPGFGGQAFLSDMLGKIREIRAMDPHLDLQVDGGINASTGRLAVEAGANLLVAGSFLFSAQDVGLAMASLRRL